MTPIVACMVCAPPLDALLTSGLHAGVLVMALVAIGVIAALGRGAMRLLREDRAALEAGTHVPHDVGQSFSSARSIGPAHGGSSAFDFAQAKKELPYVEGRHNHG
jgi:hypothetical protein